MSPALFTARICLIAVAVITGLGGWWQTTGAAIALLIILYGVVKSGAERNTDQ